MQKLMLAVMLGALMGQNLLAVDEIEQIEQTPLSLVLANFTLVRDVHLIKSSPVRNDRLIDPSKLPDLDKHEDRIIVDIDHRYQMQEGDYKDNDYIKTYSLQNRDLVVTSNNSFGLFTLARVKEGVTPEIGDNLNKDGTCVGRITRECGLDMISDGSFTKTVSDHIACATSNDTFVLFDCKHFKQDDEDKKAAQRKIGDSFSLDGDGESVITGKVVGNKVYNFAPYLNKAGTDAKPLIWTDSVRLHKEKIACGAGVALAGISLALTTSDNPLWSIPTAAASVGSLLYGYVARQQKAKFNTDFDNKYTDHATQDIMNKVRQNYLAARIKNPVADMSV